MKQKTILVALVLVSLISLASAANQTVGVGESVAVYFTQGGVTTVVINPSDLPEGTIIVNINMTNYYNKTQIDEKYNTRLATIESRIGVLESNITGSSYEQEIKIPVLWMIIISFIGLLVLVLLYLVLFGGGE